MLLWLIGLLFLTRYALQGLGRMGPPTLAGLMELIFRSAFALIGMLTDNVILVFVSQAAAWVLIPSMLTTLKKFNKISDGETFELSVKS